MGGSNRGWESIVGRRNGHGDREACSNADTVPPRLQV